MVADARGHTSGVLHKDVSSYPWTHYAIPIEIAQEVGLDMSERPTYAEMRRDTIRKGSRGNAVAELQGILNAWDPDLQMKVDGKFGAATHAAVIRFQQAHGLTDDGVVGPNTWTVLLRLAVEPDDGDQEHETLEPEDQTPDVAALVADVNQAMVNLQMAVSALVNSVKGGETDV
ncbi:MAG: peptidoglycan-binding protein [Clostridia bacterium]|nr:peptidoglycan-binding protein [Clostridia bacterium]